MSSIDLNQNLEENFKVYLSNSLSLNSSFKYFETSTEKEQESFIYNKEEEEKSIFDLNINNIKSLLEIDKKKNYFSELSFINKVESNIISCSNLRINNNINYTHNDDNENIGEIKDLNNLSDNIQKENIVLSKKRKIFEVSDNKNFFVFSFGEYDKESRKIINETLDDIQNGKIKNNSFLDQSESSKISHKKKKNIKRRKDNSDNITKKIKTRYLKALKNKIK